MNSTGSLFCSGPLDLRARTQGLSVLRSDTPTRLQRLPLALRRQAGSMRLPLVRICTAVTLDPWTHTAKELVRWRKGDDPFLYMERKALLAALHQTWGGVEGARVALAKACRRLRGE